MMPPMPTMNFLWVVQHKHENQTLVLEGKLGNPLVEFTIDKQNFPNSLWKNQQNGMVVFLWFY